MTRAGYLSKKFDTDTIPWLRYRFLNDTFFRYQFYEINFNKITLSPKKKTLVLLFQLLDVYTDSMSPEPLHKGTKYIQHNKSEQIILIKLN